MEVALARLQDRVCIINGAASEIGAAVAKRFKTEGAVVIGVDRVEHSVGDLSIQADLTNEAEVEGMFDQVVSRFARLDVVYNNVGLMDRGDRDLGVHLARRGIRVNAVLFGPIDTATQRAAFERNPGALEKRETN